jgi:hypothetical protein
MRHGIGQQQINSLTATNYASKGGSEPKLNILGMDFTPKL